MDERFIVSCVRARRALLTPRAIKNDRAREHVQITQHALTHGVSPDQIAHAYTNRVVGGYQRVSGEGQPDRYITLGYGSGGQMLQLGWVYTSDGSVVIFHAMPADETMRARLGL